MNAPEPLLTGVFSLEEARGWVGRCVELVRPHLGFEPGTRCVVHCVIDFGDGLLLWVVTDDGHARDVDQFDADDFRACFRVLDAGPAPGRWGPPALALADAPTPQRSTHGTLGRLRALPAATGRAPHRAYFLERFRQLVLEAD